MAKTFYKFKAHETKSITSAVLELPNTVIDVNESAGHANLVINDCIDNLLVEALNQITTVNAEIRDNNIVTDYSRYIYKLNPELKSNKTRLKLLRLLKPIGILFTIRNLNNTNRFLKLTHPQFLSFQTKWNSIYGNLEYEYDQWKDEYNKDHYYILINDSFKTIVEYAIDNYIIDDTPERVEFKKQLTIDTISQVDFLINSVL